MKTLFVHCRARVVWAITSLLLWVIDRTMRPQIWIAHWLENWRSWARQVLWDNRD